MKRQFTIYIDLDDTLIHSLSPRPGITNSKNRAKIVLPITPTKSDSSNWLSNHLNSQFPRRKQKTQEIYYTALRSHALPLLAELRKIAPTILFTTASRDYASAINLAFTLGFTESEILPLEEWTDEIQTPYGSPTYNLKETNTHPNSYLIDNYAPDQAWPIKKQNYLGIKATRYFQIRTFDGNRDPKQFDHEVSGLLTTIKTLNSVI